MSTAIPASVSNEKLIIAGRAYSSRLIIGTGKYRSYEQMRSAHEASGAEMVTVAVRRPDGRVEQVRVGTAVFGTRSRVSILDTLMPLPPTCPPPTGTC